MRLWLRIAVFMAVISVLPLVLTSVRAIQISTQEAERSSREILVRDADALATFVDTWLADQVQSVSGWMQLFPVAGQSFEQHESLQKSVFLAVPTLVTVALVDDGGVPLVRPLYLSEPPAPDSTLAGRKWGTAPRASELIERIPLTEALAERTTVSSGVVGLPYLPTEARTPSVPVGVTGPFGEELVLGAELSLAVVERAFAQQSGPERRLALVTLDGQRILGEEPVPEGLRPMLGSRSTFSTTLDGGREVRGAVAPIHRAGWAVVVTQPAEVAGRAAREIRERTLGVVLIAIVLALVFGAGFARTLTQPIRRLRDVALAVSRGHFGQRVEIGRRDELGELAYAFNYMSRRLARNEARLKAQQAEIAAFNEELQQRVEERTHELERTQQHLVRSGQLAAVAEVGAGLAHELNNPLAAILGLTQVLRARQGEGQDGESLARIEEQAERCRQVVSAMLRLSAGEVDPGEQAVVDLREILREVLGLVRGPFRQRGVVVTLQEPENALPVRIHPLYGSRILAQILHAVRAGLEEGATLHVSAKALEGEEEVAIDLDPDRPIALGSSRDDFLASGMGLWVARHLLAQVGGRLEQPDPPRVRWRIHLPGA